MKFFNFVKILSANLFLFYLSSASAFVVYNHTDQPLVFHGGGTSNMAVTIPAQGSSACDPNSSGCYGRISPHVVLASSRHYEYIACQHAPMFFKQGERGWYLEIYSQGKFGLNSGCKMVLCRDGQGCE